MAVIARAFVIDSDPTGAYLARRVPGGEVVARVGAGESLLGWTHEELRSRAPGPIELPGPGPLFAREEPLEGDWRPELQVIRGHRPADDRLARAMRELVARRRPG